MIIYKITNKINGKIYIGQTTQEPKLRWQKHCTPFSARKMIVSKSIQKYGKENFLFEVIDNANSLDELNEKEVYWINHFDSRNKEKGYNIAFGGDNKKMTDETKEKLSLVHKGKSKPPMSEEHRRKISEAAKKRKLSPETKEKIRLAHLGLKPTKETKKKLSLVKKGKKQKREHVEAREKIKAENRKTTKYNSIININRRK